MGERIPEWVAFSFYDTQLLQNKIWPFSHVLED